MKDRKKDRIDEGGDSGGSFEISEDTLKIIIIVSSAVGALLIISITSCVIYKKCCKKKRRIGNSEDPSSKYR